MQLVNLRSAAQLAESACRIVGQVAGLVGTTSVWSQALQWIAPGVAGDLNFTNIVGLHDGRALVKTAEYLHLIDPKVRSIDTIQAVGLVSCWPLGGNILLLCLLSSGGSALSVWRFSDGSNTLITNVDRRYKFETIDLSVGCVVLSGADGSRVEVDISGIDGINLADIRGEQGPIDFTWSEPAPDADGSIMLANDLTVRPLRDGSWQVLDADFSVLGYLYGPDWNSHGAPVGDRSFVSGTVGGAILYWDLDVDNPVDPPSTIVDIWGLEKSVVLSGGRLVAAGYEDELLLITTDGAVESYVLGNCAAEPEDFKHLSGGKFIVGCADGSLQLWDADAGKCLQSVLATSSEVYEVVTLSDGDIVALSRDYSLSCWSRSTGRVSLFHHELLNSSRRIIALDGKRFVTEGSGLVVWQILSDGSIEPTRVHKLCGLLEATDGSRAIVSVGNPDSSGSRRPAHDWKVVVVDLDSPDIQMRTLFEAGIPTAFVVIRPGLLALAVEGVIYGIEIATGDITFELDTTPLALDDISGLKILRPDQILSTHRDNYCIWQLPS